MLHFQKYLLILLISTEFLQTALQNKAQQSKTSTVSWREDVTRAFVSLTPRQPEEFYGDNHYCSGVVISERHILTAAVCVMNKNRIKYHERNLLCVAGWPRRLLYSHEAVERVRASRIIVHPLWIVQDTNNIAVIVLERPLKHANSSVNIAQLPKTDFDFQAAVNCRLIGWGRRYKNGPLAGEVKVIDLKILEKNDCPEMDYDFRREDEICAIDPKYNMKAPCPGDMGSPLFCNNILYGVATTTNHCHDNNAVSLFTDVSRHMDFIEMVLKSYGSNLNAHFSIVCFGSLVTAVFCF